MVYHEGNRLDRGLNGVERDNARAHDGTDRGHPRILDRRDERSVRQQIDLEEVRARYEPDELSGVGDDRKAVVVVFGHQVRQRLDAGLWSHRDDRSGHEVADRNVYDLSHGVYLLAGRQSARAASRSLVCSFRTNRVHDTLSNLMGYLTLAHSRCSTGIVNVNVEPTPLSLFTQIRPPWSS